MRETFVRWTLAGTLVVGAAGSLFLAFLGRGGWAAAFGLGAAISLGNLHLIARAVKGLEMSARGARKHLWKGALFRFAIIAAVLALALGVFRMDVLALLAGLLVTQAVMVAAWLAWSLRTCE
ncbi:MAG TPA: ATP synthase subunit I [Candidatus Methylomirabilis sp.]|nr:ATP synthase subunit I [Candidatus Methylomirabilis sp.]